MTPTRNAAVAGAIFATLLGAGALAAPPAATPAPAGAPHAATPHGMPEATGPVVASDARKIVWSCQVEQVGSLPVMVDFTNSTALSTRSPGVSKAKVEGDVVRWQEDDAQGAHRFTLNRKTGALELAEKAGGKDVVRKGKCGPPARH
jgi:hypothetical protein